MLLCEIKSKLKLECEIQKEKLKRTLKTSNLMLQQTSSFH